MTDTLLITCLGNPGRSYQKTRHNAGFIIGEALINKLSMEKKSTKFNSELFQTQINNTSIKVLFPQTFMNLSGKAVKDTLMYYKLNQSKLLVIYDDYELNIGQLRLRKNGSAGSHNGMKSIIENLKSTEFTRLRIGIGPRPELINTSEFVLGQFTDNELIEIKKHTDKILQTIIQITQNNFDKAQLIANTKSN